MSFGEAIAPLVGRCMLAALFVLAGLQKMQNWNDSAFAMAQHGIGAIPVLLALSVVVELGAGLGLAVGFRTRLMALILFMYTLVVSFLMHDFWAMGDADLMRTEMQLFAKNMAIAGGLLVMVGHGAGRWSYDSWRDAD
ncbi:MAG: DoxX family protein [Alphaproteobacteria bacterium]|nr:DoxX family protein [Alphaproteobacteria bacterium]